MATGWFFPPFQTQPTLRFDFMGSDTTYASNFHRLVKLRPWRRQWKVLRRIQSGASSMAWASLVFWFSTGSSRRPWYGIGFMLPFGVLHWDIGLVGSVGSEKLEAQS